RPGVAVDPQRLAPGLELPLLAEGVLLRRTLVGHEVDAAAHVAHEQVELAVAVPIDGVDDGGRAGDARLLARRHLDPLALVDDDRALVGLLELGVAGDQDHVARVPAAAADVDRLAVPVLELDGGAELALALALEEEDLAGPGAGEEVGDAV